MRLHHVLALTLAVSLSGCATDSPSEPAGAPAPEAAETPTPMPGSDRDAHGCIPSAGYQWCARTNRCERSWELAKAQGFGNDQAAFTQYCRNPAR